LDIHATCVNMVDQVLIEGRTMVRGGRPVEAKHRRAIA
jgi:hypothetical protein